MTNFELFAAIEQRLVRKVENGGAVTQTDIATFPNWRTTATNTLLLQGAQPRPDDGGLLALGEVGRVDVPLSALNEPARYAIVQEVLRLATPDQATLDSALSIAKTLRNPRDEWAARVAE